MTETPRAGDGQSYAELCGEMTRRRMLRGVTAAGLGLAVGSGLPELAAAQSNERGWASAYVDVTADPPLHEKETCSDERYQGSILGTTHSLEYLGATWVDFGDPEDGSGGAWKHTFVLSGTGAVAEVERDGGPETRGQDCVEGDVTFSAGHAFDETSMSVEVADDRSADYLAVSERRDASLTGFASWANMDGFVENMLPVGKQKEISYGQAMREGVLGSSEQLYGDALAQSIDDRNAYREQVDNRNDWVVGAVSLGLGAVLGAATGGTAVVLGALAISAVDLAIELLNDVEFVESEVEYDNGFHFEYIDDNTEVAYRPGSGHFATFDAYVSPAAGDSDEPGTVSFDVNSRHHAIQNSHAFEPGATFDEEDVREYYDFYPEVTWTVNIEQVGHPDDIPGETNIHQARVEECSRPEANKPSSIGQRPNALFSIEPRPGLTNGPITFDEFSWSPGDTEILEREWSLSVVESQSGIDDADLPNGGEWSGTEQVEVGALTPGTYRMTLTVYNENESDEMSKTFAVTPKPSAEIEIGDSGDGAPDPGDTVTLDASGSSDVDGPIQTRFWRIVGPEQDVEKWGEVVDHEFPAAGEYSVSLTVTDQAGANHTATETITVGDASDDGTTGDGETPTEGDTTDGSDTEDGGATPTDAPTATDEPTATATDSPTATATDSPTATSTETSESDGGITIGDIVDAINELL